MMAEVEDDSASIRSHGSDQQGTAICARRQHFCVVLSQIERFCAVLLQSTAVIVMTRTSRVV